jgi:hypothetical protein
VNMRINLLIVALAFGLSCFLLEGALVLAYSAKASTRSAKQSEKKEVVQVTQNSDDSKLSRVTLPCERIAVLSKTAPQRCVLNNTENEYGMPVTFYNNKQNWIEYESALQVGMKNCQQAINRSPMKKKNNAILTIRFPDAGEFSINKWVCLNLAKMENKNNVAN